MQTFSELRKGCPWAIHASYGAACKAIRSPSNGIGGVTYGNCTHDKCPFMFWMLFDADFIIEE